MGFDAKDFGKRMAQGFAMGFGAGLAVGGAVGLLSVLTVGTQGRSFAQVMGKQMITTGGWLGAVLAIGSVIR